MKWKIIERYKRFNLWHNFKCNYNECFMKGDDPNQLESQAKEKSKVYSEAQKKAVNKKIKFLLGVRRKENKLWNQVNQ